MIIALTGTPGTGKTTIAEKLAEKGYTIINIKTLVHEHEGEFIEEYDEAADAVVPDLDRVDAFIQALARENATKTVIVDGHLAHLLTAEYVILLRCSPSTLTQRLKEREYAPEKLRENLEAEAVDVILIEAVENYGTDRVFEIDTTKLSVPEVEKELVAILNNVPGAREAHVPGKIDWSDEVLAWF